LIKIIEITAFIDKYAASESIVSSNPLRKIASTSDFQGDILTRTGMSFEDTLIWLSLRGQLSLVWNLLSIYPETSQVLSSESTHPLEKSIRAFQQLLASHPYTEKYREEVADSSMAALLQIWKQKVQAFISAEQLLTSKRPYLYSILQIFLGSDQLMLEYSSSNGSSWTHYLLSLCLYSYAPPLTRRDLLRIADKAFASYRAHCPVSEREVKMHEVMIAGFEGNLAAIVRSIYELGVQHASTTSHLICLTSAAHLSLLIAAAETSSRNNQSQLLIDNPSFANETSFLEELLLEVAELKSMLNFPVDVIIGCLSLCPKRGNAYSLALLSHRKVSSDDEAMQLAEALRFHGLLDNAKAKMAERGVYWWNQCMLKQHLCCYNAHCDAAALGKLSAAKAVYFFQCAEEEKHVRGILDLAFVRCAYAVKRARKMFPGLLINPIRPAPPLIPGALWYCAPGSREYIRLTTAPELVTEGRIASIMESDELVAALQEAVDVLAVLDPASNAYPEAEGLRGYVSGIKLHLNSSSWEERKLASQMIATVLLNGCMFDRHWLHLLELIVWLHHSKDEARAKMMADNSSDNFDPIPRSLFTKSQAYGFLNALQRLDSSLSFTRYCNGCSEEQLIRIRQSLLVVLSDSILLENEEKGAKYRAMKEAADAKELSKFRQRMRGGLSEEEYKQAMVLQGSIFAYEHLLPKTIS
jgi:hypothetical protein